MHDTYITRRNTAYEKEALCSTVYLQCALWAQAYQRLFLGCDVDYTPTIVPQQWDLSYESIINNHSRMSTQILPGSMIHDSLRKKTVR